MDNKNKKAFLIGVGGAGVSALAKYLKFQGYDIYGSSNMEKDYIIEDLEKNYDLKFTLGHSGKAIDDTFDLVVYTPAISFDNEDYKKAKDLNIPTFSYPQFLGQISKKHFTLSVAGTNGKTTVTSMIIEVLANEHRDKKVEKSSKDIELEENFFSIVGGILPKFNSNFIFKGDKNFVLETCEFKRNFLNIFPNVVLITNITADHLDYYKDLADIQKAFVEFLQNMIEKNKETGESSRLICNFEEKNLAPVLDFAKENNIDIFDYSGLLTKDLKVSLEGEHNRQNAAAALKTLEVLGYSTDSQEEAMEYLANDFLGSKRRFEILGKSKNGALLIDDFAHNPEGVDMIVDGVKKKYPNKNLNLLFHPHLFSRTKIFFKEFVKALENKNIDDLVILPIYAAREEDKGEVSSKDIEKELLKNGIKKVQVLGKEEAQKYFEALGRNDVLLFAGAGDGNKVLYGLLDK